ncbi:negative regulator of vesicle formation-related [Anaeramoeba flamelloides]|uniref:GPI inositol-deacylase n=1 Tax=Anaeramoeba flamelloides TaxID=1746091 RepID=A0AAV8A965_9EUKA|nr:negative regulator of vesicle formation-related [Anaeramoeba flamelloides]
MITKNCSLLQIIPFVIINCIAIILAIYGLYLTRSKIPNLCELTLIGIDLEPIDNKMVAHRNYRLFKAIVPQGEHPKDLKANSKPKIPILFIHGHSGNYSNAKSIASTFALLNGQFNRDKGNWEISKGYEEGYDPIDREFVLKYLNSSKYDPINSAFEFEVYSIDFKHQLNAFSSLLLSEQTEYLLDCVKYILSAYSTKDDSQTQPEKVFIIAHSMGGMVSRLALSSSRIEKDQIGTVLTLSTPHNDPPYPCDTGTTVSYRNFLHSPSFAPLDHENTNDKNSKIASQSLIVSIIGGVNDELIRPDNAYLGNTKHINKDNQDIKEISYYTSSIESCFTSSDHKSIIWCNQIVNKISKLVYNLVDPSTQQLTLPIAEQEKIFDRSLTSSLKHFFTLQTKNDGKGNNNLKHYKPINNNDGLILDSKINIPVTKEFDFVVLLKKEGLLERIKLINENENENDNKVIELNRFNKSQNYLFQILPYPELYTEEGLNTKEYFFKHYWKNQQKYNLMIVKQELLSKYTNIEFELNNKLLNQLQHVNETNIIYEFEKINEISHTVGIFDFSKKITIKNLFSRIQFNSFLDNNFAYNLIINTNQINLTNYQLPIVYLRAMDSQYEKIIRSFEIIRQGDQKITLRKEIRFPQWSLKASKPELLIFQQINNFNSNINQDDPNEDSGDQIIVSINIIKTLGLWFYVSWPYNAMIVLIIVTLIFTLMQTKPIKVQKKRSLLDQMIYFIRLYLTVSILISPVYLLFYYCFDFLKENAISFNRWFFYNLVISETITAIILINSICFTIILFFKLIITQKFERIITYLSYSSIVLLVTPINYSLILISLVILHWMSFAHFLKRIKNKSLKYSNVIIKQFGWNSINTTLVGMKVTSAIVYFKHIKNLQFNTFHNIARSYQLSIEWSFLLIPNIINTILQINYLFNDPKAILHQTNLITSKSKFWYLLTSFLFLFCIRSPAFSHAFAWLILLPEFIYALTIEKKFKYTRLKNKLDKHL